MYLKTPKRYTVKGRKRHLFSFRRLLLWLLTPLVIVAGWMIYQRREVLAPTVGGVVEQAYNYGNEMIATRTAPTPLPTENPANLINRADMNWVSGRVEDAIIEYEQAVDLVPNDVTTHYNLAYGLIVDGRYEAGLAVAESAITADPYASDAWAIRALAQVRTGDAGGALASAQHALQLNPENPRAYAFITEAFIELSLNERAQEAAEEAIILDPNNAEAYYARAQVNQAINFDREAARADFQTAYDLAPYLTDAAVEMAYVDAALGDYDSAISTLNQVKDANPDDTTTLYALGYMYYAGLGDPNSAADELARCVTVDPENAACHYYYGRVLIGLERYDDAAEMLTRSVQLGTDSDNPNPYYNYWAGEAQIYLGNCPLALTYLRPGYELALEREDDDLADALQGSIQECGAFDNAFTAPTPTPAAPDTETDEAGEAA
jgi:tetratricopeptide (TPR) repeat protein